MNLSDARSERSPWVLNGEYARFVFGDATFVKLRQKFRKHERVAGAISTSFLSHVKSNGILRNKDALEISCSPGFLNQGDVLVNGLG